MTSIALLGDYDASAVAHQAIPKALDLASRASGIEATWAWIGTERLDASLGALSGFDGVWCVPAGPYRNTDGVLGAIRHVRERRVPFLGTCAGFQHAVLECAAALWGVTDPAHAELDPGASDPVIAPLSCGLVEQRGAVRFAPGSRLAAAYGALESDEGYHCNYGLSERFAPRLESGPLRATSWDTDGDVRGVELDGHPFFVATLFQPERAALQGVAPAIVVAFVRAVAEAGAESPLRGLAKAEG